MEKDVSSPEVARACLLALAYNPFLPARFRARCRIEARKIEPVETERMN